MQDVFPCRKHQVKPLFQLMYNIPGYLGKLCMERNPINHTAPTIQKGHLKLCLQNKSEPVGYMTTPVSIQSVLYVQYINNVITSRIAETTKANGVRIVKKVHHTCIITTTGFTNNTLYIII